VARQTVADELGLVQAAFRTALARADVVIATGGLGPTEDDLTREAAAAALGRTMERDQAILDALRARFAARGRTMRVVNEKQANVIDGARVLRNENGTAPGQCVEHGTQLVFLLPGPPLEMRPMFETHVRPMLAGRAGATVLRTRISAYRRSAGERGRGAGGARSTRRPPTRARRSWARRVRWSCA